VTLTPVGISAVFGAKALVVPETQTSPQSFSDARQLGIVFAAIWQQRYSHSSV
jgi:hypothetical protein